MNFSLDISGITTYKESGRLAVELMLAQMAEDARPAGQANLPLALVQRASA